MLVTIVLTCYKQEKYIEETISSVINQKYNNRELLIGDDSPDNNCRKIIQRYTKKYHNKIKAWHHNPNKGIVNNMLFLLSKINKKSAYIAFLEGDDCLKPDYLSKKIDIFKNNPNVKLIYNEFSSCDENGNIINVKELDGKTKNFGKLQKINYNRLINEVFYNSRSSLMVKTCMIYKYELLPSFIGEKTMISDVYFFNQIAHEEEIYGIEEPLLNYRVHKDSASKQYNGTIIMLLEYIKYFGYLKDQNYISIKTYRKVICKFCFLIAIHSIKNCFSMGYLITLNIINKTVLMSIKYRFINYFQRFR